MDTFYTVVTVHDDHTDTSDHLKIDAALNDFYFRQSLMRAFSEDIVVRLLRTSKTQILDITPGREDSN